MPEWKTVPLADLLEGGRVSYGIVQPGNNFADGVPIVRVKDINSGISGITSPLRVDPKIAAKHARTTLKGGELLVSLVGTVGETAIVPSTLAGWNVARAIAVLRPTGVTAQWLRFCFSLPSVKHELQRVLNTTVQATLNLSDLKNVQIPLPPEAVRDGISEVLRAFDDKVSANRRLITSADTLATMIFQSMSSDGHPLPLTDVARFVNGKAFTKDASGTGRVVIRIAELNSGIGGSTVYNDIGVPDVHLAHPGDLLFAWSGSLTLHRWFRPEGVINQHIFKVIPINGYPLWCVSALLARKLEEFRAIAADKATTMGHIQRRHLEEPVQVPVRTEIERHDSAMTGLWKRALQAEQESLQLEEIRDALLPELMSGRIRVKDAEVRVEEVL